jgi:hypothetical protein
MKNLANAVIERREILLFLMKLSSPDMYPKENVGAMNAYNDILAVILKSILSGDVENEDN